MTSEVVHVSAYPMVAATDWGRAVYLAAHFLGLQCLSQALVSGMGATMGRGTGDRKDRLAAVGSAYLTVSMHCLSLKFHSGESPTLLTLKTGLAEVIFFGTLWVPMAWLMFPGPFRRVGAT